MTCYAQELHATVVVDGDVNILSERLLVWVKALRTQDNTKIFDKRISLSLTPEMRAVISHDASSGTADTSAEIPDAGQHGFTSPTCIYCPIAHYSGAASQAKIQGTVLLTVVVDADGFPMSVRILRGLPCGLNHQALESVKKWKFQPATGPEANLR